MTSRKQKTGILDIITRIQLTSTPFYLIGLISIVTLTITPHLGLDKGFKWVYISILSGFVALGSMILCMTEISTYIKKFRRQLKVVRALGITSAFVAIIIGTTVFTEEAYFWRVMLLATLHIVVFFIYIFVTNKNDNDDEDAMEMKPRLAQLCLITNSVLIAIVVNTIGTSNSPDYAVFETKIFETINLYLILLWVISMGYWVWNLLDSFDVSFSISKKGEID